jgi:hypothetical protein
MSLSVYSLISVLSSILYLAMWKRWAAFCFDDVGNVHMTYPGFGKRVIQVGCEGSFMEEFTYIIYKNIPA